MHPILAHPGRLAGYAALWVPPGTLLAALLALQGALPWPHALATAVPLSVAYGLLCLSAWYVCLGTPIRTSGAIRVVATAVVASGVSSAVWLLMATAWMQVLARLAAWPPATPAFRASAPTFFGFGLLLYLLAMTAAYLLAAFETSREAERRGYELQVMAREAELRALRAQIDPHFLFNSLQSISALTTADPSAARRMCLLLADFLRETLTIGGRGRIRLAQELALAERFLAIEQVRFGERLRVVVTAGGAEECLVPALVLQPLVENAVTHGIAHAIDGGVVSIHAVRGPATLAITIENPCDADRPAGRGTGMGLVNVRSRVHTMFGADGSVRSGEADGRYRVRVELPAVTE